MRLSLSRLTAPLAFFALLAGACSSSSGGGSSSPTSSPRSASALAPVHGTYSPSIDPANFVQTIDNPYWPLEPLIRGDVADEVAKLKQQSGQSILKFGTGELDRTLMEHNLFDEYHFWLFPVVAGSGQRLLDGIGSTHLNLLDTTRFSSGIVVLTYTPK